ncbi:sirohydrochlorin chelatase [Mycobacterium sp.]|uniref:sirohydrochlorin chelatase n=1 Tax=Mycobacterium sp. TaxID=1785 RepID=UPI003D6C6BEC
MTLILVAHGTRRPEGLAMIGDLVERVGSVLGHPVQVGFVDVLGPTPSEILSAAAATAEPAVVVPAFLSRGYHVHTDLPMHIAASGHPDVTVTPALGPSPHIAQIVSEQLSHSGWRPGDSVILAAAGTSDSRARADLRATATLLSALLGSSVRPAFAATGAPSVREAVTEARSRSDRRVAVASYLLADGMFAHQLRNCGADLVSEPLSTHPTLARLIAGRFQAARTCARV